MSAPVVPAEVATPPVRPGGELAPRPASWAKRAVQRGKEIDPPQWVRVVATVAAWALAIQGWVSVCIATAGGSGLGFDLYRAWQAERLFAHGAAPYAIRGFVYPPSCLLLLRPLAAADAHQMQIIGLVTVAVVAWVSVMLSAVVVGKKWWGFTAAITLYVLHFTNPLRGELSLENITVLSFLAIVLFYLLALRGHWTAAGAVIGLSLAFKPLLIVVLLVFVITRRWRALAVAIAVPVVLNAIAFLLVANPGGVWSKLPSLLDRTGVGVKFNSAWVDVVRLVGLPVGFSILFRLITVALVIVATWLSWTRLRDPALRLVTATSMLVIGSYLAGTLSENHFMLVLVPLAMTVVLPGSPMRTVTGVLATLWLAALLLPPASWLSLNTTANYSTYRAIAMSLILVTVVVVLWRRRRLAEADPAAAQSPAAVASSPA